MSKRNPFWLRQIPEYSLVWGALDLTPYLYGVPSAYKDTMSNWTKLDFELHRIDEQFRIDLYLMFNQSHELRGTPMFYAGNGYRFEAIAYSQSQEAALPIIKGLLAESPVVTRIEGILKHPQDRATAGEFFNTRRLYAAPTIP